MWDEGPAVKVGRRVSWHAKDRTNNDEGTCKQQQGQTLSVISNAADSTLILRNSEVMSFLQVARG